ncbi:hypothetical protein DYU05_00840 [Mucilaginibacter terrenus]|uniref:Cytochrome P460 domain-containing protein n=1 Tax=Mucilaginibacter terrenus TaxID=2482727 RepID=A0A3E2NTB4_9SPHI|nr:hypothetical protein [Mucilaginibacter terrenus]RFZ84209.1 hypothetical protein DYU05_00840 [Mucilaginibacter terrenus]
MKSSLKILVAGVIILSGCQSATDPDQLINKKASLPQTFSLSDLHQKVITSFINNKEHTTGILYGNEQAYSASNHTLAKKIPGASYTLVTWRQQDDPHWFGARIPGNLISAEKLTWISRDGITTYQYQKFSGKDLSKLADTTGSGEHIRFILSQKASVMP